MTCALTGVPGLWVQLTDTLVPVRPSLHFFPSTLLPVWTNDAHLSVTQAQATAGSLSQTPEAPVDTLVSTELLWEASEPAENSTCCPLDAPWGREIPHFDIMHFQDCML